MILRDMDIRQGSVFNAIQGIGLLQAGAGSSVQADQEAANRKLTMGCCAAPAFAVHLRSWALTPEFAVGHQALEQRLDIFGSKNEKS